MHGSNLIRCTPSMMADYTRFMMMVLPPEMPRVSNVCKMEHGKKVHALQARWSWDDTEVVVHFQGNGLYSYESGWVEEFLPLYCELNVPIDQLPRHNIITEILRET